MEAIENSAVLFLGLGFALLELIRLMLNAYKTFNTTMQETMKQNEKLLADKVKLQTLLSEANLALTESDVELQKYKILTSKYYRIAVKQRDYISQLKKQIKKPTL